MVSEIGLQAEIHLRLIEHLGTLVKDWKDSGITVSDDAREALIDDLAGYVLRDLSPGQVLELATKHVKNAARTAIVDLSL